MERNEQSRWQPTGTQALWMGIAVVGLFASIVVFGGYYFEWKWTGYPKRTPWDWVDLLIVPVVLALGGYLFTRSETRRTQNIANLQRDLDRRMADERRQDDMLQAYLEGMSQLLTDEKQPLHTAQVGDHLSAVGRANTLTVLMRLKGLRRGSVLQFLYETGLINKDRRVLDLWRADLREAVLGRGTYLSRGNLSGAYLMKANLTRVNLSEADLSETYLIEANLREADLRETDLGKANLIRALLIGADLKEANLSETDSRHVYLSEGNLTGANLREANLREADLNGANLREADLREADLGRANLIGALLVGADLKEANLMAANLYGAKLRVDPSEAKREATLGVNLREAYLRANLSEATLIGTNLSEVDLREADLGGANLIGANLREANLRGAELIRANLYGAHLDGANLREADLGRANLIGANLREANLSEANLSEANLNGAKLSGAMGVTNKELHQQASSLEDATMPDGQKYEDWLKDKEVREGNGKNSGSK